MKIGSLKCKAWISVWAILIFVGTVTLQPDAALAQDLDTIPPETQEMLESVDQPGRSLILEGNGVSAQGMDDADVTAAVQKHAASGITDIYIPYVSCVENCTGGTQQPPPTPEPEFDLTVTITQVVERIEAAQNILDHGIIQPHDQEFPEYVSPAEFPGAIPLWVVNHNQPDYPFIIGHSDGTGNDFTEIISETVGYDFGSQTVIFNQHVFSDDGHLILWVDQIHTENGGMELYISIREYTSNDVIDLNIGNFRVANNVQNLLLPYNVRHVFDQPGHSSPSARIPPRHGQTMYSLRAAQLTREFDARSAGAFPAQVGLSADLWGSIYGQIYPEDSFPFFSGEDGPYKECFRDVDGINTPDWMWGLTGALYPRDVYESKVCESPAGYVEVLREDPFGWMHFILNIVNKYDDPDRVIDHPSFVRGETTPRQIMRDIESNWFNGHGIRALNKPTDVSSGIRTFLFFIIETNLCFDYGDEISCGWVDYFDDLMLRIQAGMPPFDQYEIRTTDHGELFVPYARGCTMLAWEESPFSGSASAQSTSTQEFELSFPERSVVEEFLDTLIGHAPETKWPILCNGETVLAFIQALENYACKVFGKCYDVWMPNDRITTVYAGENWLFTVPVYLPNTGPQQVLDITKAQLICDKLRGNEVCYPNQANFEILLGKSYRLKEIPDTVALYYEGIRPSEITEIPCETGPGGSYCSLPTNPMPFSLINASTVSSVATAQGCTNVTLGTWIPDGTYVTYPTTNFKITEETGFEISSTTDCNFSLSRSTLEQAVQAQ